VSDTPADLSPLSGINRVLHEPVRLQITALLYTLDSADFIFVMNQLGLTWGNLSAHLSKLEEAGYINIEKSFRGKLPQTLCSLTDIGRSAFEVYREQLKKMVQKLS